jgi:hypothetical protein
MGSGSMGMNLRCSSEKLIQIRWGSGMKNIIHMVQSQLIRPALDVEKFDRIKMNLPNMLSGGHV